MKNPVKEFNLLFVIISVVFSGLINVACRVSENTADKTIVILHTNDTHSQLDTFSIKYDRGVGGILRRAEYVEEVRANNKTVFLFDAGDFSVGTTYYSLFKGQPDIYFMNQLGYDVATLGNHEFDDGVQHLANRLKNAEFSVVCSNYDFGESDLSGFVKPYTTIDKNGCKVGVFGLTPDLHGLSAAPNLWDTIQYKDPIFAAKEMVAQLKKEKCDLIVCLSHLGTEPKAEDTEMAVSDTMLVRQVPGIDIIIGGHTHCVVDTVINSTRLVQNAAKGTTIGRFTIKRK